MSAINLIVLKLLWLSSLLSCNLAFTILSSNIAGLKSEVGTISNNNRYHNVQLGVLKLSSYSSDEDVEDTASKQRRSFLLKSIVAPFISTGILLNDEHMLSPNRAYALNDGPISTTANAEITSKIFIQLKGLPTELESTVEGEDIITIGLFGKESPQPVSILQQLVSASGYPAKCKPKEIRSLQREQLEANKVYNSCMEIQDTKGVNYDLSTVWRIIKDEKIDLGAVSGKFVARENPTFEGSNSLKHDVMGVVSVRLGNDGGFGFTIYTGSGSSPSDLDETNIVVGKVIGGMDVLKKLNEVPVIQSSSVGYKALAGGDPSKRNAPSRACRYGSSELYCSEFKPLKKISLFRTGMVN
jgi:cyclophilin family peptidyl-prolyl cis-trans isomerase